MRDELGFIDLKDFSRAKLVKLAVEQAEADCSSCVVRHAEVFFIPASQRVRERLAREQPQKVVRIR